MTQEVPDELTMDEISKAIANMFSELVKTNIIAVEAHNQVQGMSQAFNALQDRLKAMSRKIAEQDEKIERLDAAYDIIKSYIKGESK